MTINGWVSELHLRNEKSKAKMRVKKVPFPFLMIFFESGEAPQFACLEIIDTPPPLLSGCVLLIIIQHLFS